MVLMEKDVQQDGFAGLHVARILLFLSFTYANVKYSCTLIHWFLTIGDWPCDLTGMWKVQPDYYPNGAAYKCIIHVDCILRAAHLMPVYGNGIVPEDHKYENTLDHFKMFYVNKYIDHHAHEIIF